MFGACFGRISDSRLSKRASGDSNLSSSMPSTAEAACLRQNERANGTRTFALAPGCEPVGKQLGKQTSQVASVQYGWLVGGFVLAH